MSERFARRRGLSPAVLAGLALVFTVLPATEGHTSGTIHCKLPSTQPPGYICRGTGGADVIYGTSEDDRIDGRGGNDLIYGGDGNDRIEGGSGNDMIFGEGGNDQIDGGSGNDIISGGPGGDIIKGGSGDDSIHGDGGNDLIDGGTGKDSLNGDGGDDGLRSRESTPRADIDNCGSGTDQFDSDSKDLVASDCEISTTVTVSFTSTVP